MRELNDNGFTCLTRNYIELVNLHNNVSFHTVSVVEVQLDKNSVVEIYYIKLYNACNEREIQERICIELLWIKINNN
ncbi:hypothetical protein CMV37_21270 [Bacillus cereus]|nr:hypothetical protein CMV37_21270 [Bacillus cereus]